MKAKIIALMLSFGFASSASAVVISTTGGSIGGNPGGGALYQAAITTADIGESFTMEYAYSNSSDEVAGSTTFSILGYYFDGSDTYLDLGVNVSNTSGTDISDPHLMSFAFNMDPNMGLYSLEDDSLTDTDVLTSYDQYTNFPGLSTVDVCVYTAGCTGGNYNTGLVSGESDSMVLHLAAAGDYSAGMTLSDFAVKFQGQDSYELAGSPGCTRPDGCTPVDVPAPGTAFLLGLGLLGLASLRRRNHG